MGQSLPTIVERHDGNPGRRPVQSVYAHLSLRLRWSYDVRTGLEASEPTMSASFRDVRQVAVCSLSYAILRGAIAAELTAGLSQSAGIQIGIARLWYLVEARLIAMLRVQLISGWFGPSDMQIRCHIGTAVGY